MKRIYFFFVFIILLIAEPVLSQDADMYYARCNLKVLKGTYITWVNWQAAPTYVPAGTALRVSMHGSKATLVDIKKDMKYDLDIGANGNQFLEKFVSKTMVDLNNFPEDIRENIRQGVARLGMTKEEVYIAMGPPAKVSTGKTHNMTFEDIMKHDLWIYSRRRFGKNIGVSFDPVEGKVNDTEGIWK